MMNVMMMTMTMTMTMTMLCQVGPAVSLLHKHISLVLLLAIGLLSRLESLLHVTQCLPAVCDRIHGAYLL